MLHNKLLQHLVASNNAHVLLQTFCGSGIQVKLSCVPLLQGLSQGYGQVVSWICGLLYWEPWVSINCWLQASCGSLSCGLLHRAIWNMSAPFPECTSKRGWARRKPQAFCNLIMKVMYHHFCHILFIRSKSLFPVHIQGEELYKDVNTREQRSLGVILDIANHINSIFKLVVKSWVKVAVEQCNWVLMLMEGILWLRFFSFVLSATST